MDKYFVITLKGNIYNYMLDIDKFELHKRLLKKEELCRNLSVLVAGLSEDKGLVKAIEKGIKLLKKNKRANLNKDSLEFWRYILPEFKSIEFKNKIISSNS